ncbi:hypothetical protein [Streptomyces sp. NBC_00582]|uniref:hypothetical protein n=1 Tax=Streptomyces sp. NBC_00582 TaxID=2975783 RepID=UPI002E7FFFE4|nr:hypothetical protein [Streptomyces sp. NBC_00582]WUB61510.1 hypothetical protein OG852_14475 [Streptomyces sp. NBC_00582]
MTSPRPVPLPSAPPFSRTQWERAVFAGADLHANHRAVALVLAHMAAGGSRLETGGPQTLGNLSGCTRLSQDCVRKGLAALESGGYITRPDIHLWTSRRIWPITLTMPPRPAAAPAGGEGAERTEPAHPSGAVS